PGRRDEVRPVTYKRAKEMTTITQEELRHYAELKAEAERAQKQLDGLRQGLLARLEAGAQAEAGEFQVMYRPVTQRRLTAESLLPVLGKARVEELKALVSPTTQRQLIVQAAPARRALPTGPWQRERDEFEI